MKNCMDLPFSDGELTNCLVQKAAEGPLPPAPAQVVQLCHPPICSISENVVPPPVGGGGVVELPTLMVNLLTYTLPWVSQAWTEMECEPVPKFTEVFSEETYA